MKKEMCLASDNIQWLQQKAELIQSLQKNAYTHKPEKIEADAVGAHVRHILDHYSSLIKGLPDGRIDYDLRERDPRIVQDPCCAVEKIHDVIDSLEKLTMEDANRPLQVRMDCGATAQWSSSSLLRELQFLVSHHVHHNALIRMILQGEGVNFQDDFGVAPSTIKHLQRQN